MNLMYYVIMCKIFCYQWYLTHNLINKPIKSTTSIANIPGEICIGNTMHNELLRISSYHMEHLQMV